MTRDKSYWRSQPKPIRFSEHETSGRRVPHVPEARPVSVLLNPPVFTVKWTGKDGPRQSSFSSEIAARQQLFGLTEMGIRDAVLFGPNGQRIY